MPSRRQSSPIQQIERLQRINAQLESRLARYKQNDQHFYRSLFETMDEGFGILELLDGPHGPLSDYSHVLTNAAYAKHAGTGDVVGKCARDLIPNEADQWVARFSEVWRTGESSHFEQELIATSHILSVTCFRIEPATRRQVAVLFRDVTARSKADQMLLQINEDLEQQVHTALSERQFFSRLVDYSAANVHVLDTEMRWLAINRQARLDFHSLYGTLPSVGDAMPALLKCDQREHDMILSLWQRALSGEQFIVTELFGLSPAQRYYELRFNCIRGDDGVVVAAFVFAYDISERVADQQRLIQAEQALRQAQKMEAVGQLTGGIAHDFNNLLGGILGAQELMQQRIQQGRFDELASLLAVSNRSAQRASAMVHRLLAFSRQQTLQPQPTDVRRLVEDMEDLIRGSLGPDFVLRSHFAEALWPTFIDPPQLENALLNLCLNARDAMHNGGLVSISAENVSLDAERAQDLDLHEGDFVRVGVKDNGQGMTADVLARAVDPFFTTKPIGRGTGLGLSMVYGFVRQSGGQLHIQSELCVGSHIELYLPRYRGVATDQAYAPRTLPLPIAASCRIVLVEDQAAMRRVMTEVLEDLGHQVQVFDSGHSAIDHLYNSPRPDLLITDVGLPDGVNGRQVAEHAQALHAGLKVLFITGYDESAAFNQGQPIPDSRVLNKPFSLALLAERATELLQS